MCNSTSNRNFLFHSRREPVYAGICVFRNAESLNEAIDAFGDALCRVLVDAREELNGFPRSKPWIKGGACGVKAQVFAYVFRFRHDIVAEHRGSARTGSNDRGEHSKRGR